VGYYYGWLDAVSYAFFRGEEIFFGSFQDY
jgi:hypothetical protein